MKSDLYNWENSIVGAIELPENVFGRRWNEALIDQVVLAQLANKRHPWAHARDRSEVRGGGRKPWRQKGTGRARHGSTRSPIWVGGGKAHGPRNERDYSQKVNAKMKKAALAVALSRKFRDGELKIFDTLMIAEPKTKVVTQKLKPFFPAKKISKYDVLFVPEAENKNILRGARNLAKVKISGPASLNVYDVLNYKNIFMDQTAVASIVKHYSL
ncbi:MAG: 50S ribosomal protein L4 [Candidatus Liptonbacteria bacterium]